MEGISRRRSRLCLMLFCVLLGASVGSQIAARLKKQDVATPVRDLRVSVGKDDIGGVVASSKGPEAGVWVIAETLNLPNKFRKIVVTDDAGRYLLPELPKANYKMWVRGYGLVDSRPSNRNPRQDAAIKCGRGPRLPKPLPNLIQLIIGFLF